MKYTLTRSGQEPDKTDGILTALRKLLPLMAPEGKWLGVALAAILVNSGLTILGPIIIGHAVDNYVITRQYHGVLAYSAYLLAAYLGAWAAGFMQTRIMGAVGQRTLFRLRNRLFTKLQELPVAFFNQNKAGDLISRINNDTDKLNQFFSRSLMQFVGNIFVIIGAGAAMLLVQPRLGGITLLPAVALLAVIQATTGWIKRTNFKGLQSLGSLSAEVQESLDNFRVIIAFNRRDYFRDRFAKVNDANYQASVAAGIANNAYTPLFGLASNLGTLIVITYGLHLIAVGDFSFGLLISYLTYVSRFYDPLRQMASLWSDLQTALAGWDRISEILNMENDLPVIESSVTGEAQAVMEFRDVSFGYPDSKLVLSGVSFKMEAGKTYALVGPTGGGKTTTASLIARLYDPTDGAVLLGGRDIRSYAPEERSRKVGFILQDPFLFAGTVGENVLYGNPEYQGLSNADLAALLKREGLDDLMARFDQGLDTPVSSTADGISLGQKQLIAFIRAILRHPDLLILDEATANVDTVTEQLLGKALDRLPKETVRVVIAHRLNTIENADEIFFVGGGAVTAAGSLEHAVEMLSGTPRIS